jgi:prepilin signal peptidase PulO-like enzyme (type II secretory pathway)
MGLFPEWTWIVGLMVGAAIGSFLNVVIYRMPRGLSLSEPKKSFCPICKHPLGPIDLMPLFSWLIQKGKCRYCDAKIPVRYFGVELLNGSLFAAMWQVYLIDGNDYVRFCFYAAAVSALVAMIYIDLELHMIPEQVNAFLSVLGLAYGFTLMGLGRPEAWTKGIPSAIAGWLAGVATLWGIAVLGRLIFKKTAMGEGDIKMARGIGAILFPVLGMISFGLAIVAGAVIGSMQAFYNQRKRKETKLQLEGMRVPVFIEGTLTEIGEDSVTVRITDTMQAQLAPNGSLQTFELDPALVFWRGEKKIEKEKFWNGLSVGAAIAINGHHEEGKLMADEIGRDLSPITQLFKSGLGYLLGIDIWGLFYVPLYKKWFGEDPFEVPEDLETFDAGATMIPFGPYLALGAILAAIFSKQLVGAWENYLNSIGGSQTAWNIFAGLPV